MTIGKRYYFARRDRRKWDRPFIQLLFKLAARKANAEDYEFPNLISSR